jgi:hypothetical protein
VSTSGAARSGLSTRAAGELVFDDVMLLSAPLVSDAPVLDASVIIADGLVTAFGVRDGPALRTERASGQAAGGAGRAQAPPQTARAHAEASPPRAVGAMFSTRS